MNFMFNNLKQSIIIFFLSILCGNQYKNGLVLKQKSTTAIIPFGEIVKINNEGEGRSLEGILFNSSTDNIYLTSLSSAETITIPKEKIDFIKAKASTKSSKNFLKGAGVGAWTGISFGALITLQQYSKYREPITIVAGAFYFTPIVTVIGSFGGGFTNMIIKYNEVKNTDIFYIGVNNWKI